MSNSSLRREQHRRYRLATIDDAGRLSIGRLDRLLGPGLERAAATATAHRLVVRFLDSDPAVEPIPDGWVEVPVRRPDGRYPYLLLSGTGVRGLLRRSRLEYPTRVRFRVEIDGRFVGIWRVR